MSPEQKAAYINAKAVATLVELVAMHAANQERIRKGFALAYTEDTFMSLITRNGLEENQLIAFFRD